MLTIEGVQLRLDGFRGNGLIGQLLRFSATGSIAVVIDFSIYQAIWHATGWIHPAKAISFVAATTVAYLLNRRWTFASPGSIGKLVGFIGLYSIAFCVNVGVNALLLWLLPEGRWSVITAFLGAQATSTTINFVVLRVAIFRAPMETPT